MGRKVLKERYDFLTKLCGIMVHFTYLFIGLKLVPVCLLWFVNFSSNSWSDLFILQNIIDDDTICTVA